MNNQINLSSAEVELIKLNREKEEIAKKEAELKKLKEIEDRIKRMYEQISEAKAWNQKVMDYATDMLSKFKAKYPGKYVMEYLEEKETFSAWGYEGDERKTYEEQEITFKNPVIVRKGTSKKVYFHKKDVSSRWSRSASYEVVASLNPYRGSGPALKNIVTIHKKIQTHIHAVKAEAERKDYTQSLNAAAVKEASDKYPTGKIELKTEWESNRYYSRKGPSGREVSKIYVDFGHFEISFKYFSRNDDGTVNLGCPSIDMKNIDRNKVVEFLIGLK